MNAHDELKSLSPTLASLPKPTTPAAPEGFFEGLPDAVLARIRAEDAAGGVSAVEVPQQGPKVVRLWYRWAAAASVAGVAVLGYWLLRPSDPAALAAAQPLTSEEIEAYVAANIDEFDEDLFVGTDVATRPATTSDDDVKPDLPTRRAPAAAIETPSQQILPEEVNEQELEQLLDDEFEVEDL